MIASLLGTSAAQLKRRPVRCVMSKFRLLNGVAAGLADSFIGRNNDIGGYWAMGVLYRASLRGGDRLIRLNLLSEESSIQGEAFRVVATNYAAHLQRLLAAYSLPSGIVSAADIVMKYGHLSPDHSWTPKRSQGDPFVCSVILCDSRGRDHVATRAGWCRPHDWRTERRSARTSGPLAALSPDQLSQLLFGLGLLNT